MEHIIGHKKVVEQFEQALKSGVFHHAYALIGKDHLGKRTIAEQFAKEYLGVNQLGTCSDYLYVKREINKKTGKTKKDISIEQAKQIVHFFSLMGSSQKKICIIDEAEHLSISAANALLKTVEEPRTNGIIIFLVEHNKALPATIFSRTHNMVLSPVTMAELTSSIQATKNPEHKDRAAKSSFGYPGIFIRALEHPAYLEEREEEVSRFLSLIGKPFSEKLKIVEELFGDKSDHISQRDVISSTLDIWLSVFGSFLAKNIVYPELKGISITQIPHICDTIFIAKRYIRQNIHPRLVIEHILLSIP